MTSKMLLICLAVVCLAYKTSAYSSCQDIYMADNRNSNGNYVIHHNGSAINVYCSFESNYGYTYISKQSYNTELNISLLYTTLDFAKIRHRKSNGIQKEVIVENLSSFQSRSTLYFGYNANTSYQGPDRNNVGLKPYLFLGFLPESFLRNYETQGYRAAGKDFTFKNCDKNPNSYITFYYNPNNTTPGRLGYTNHFMKGWIDESELLPMNNYMDTDFYFDWEMHMGGCGGFMTSHCLSNNRAALGLPFSIKPCDGLNCQNGGSCDSSVSPACCICVGNYFGDRCENINGGWTEWSVWSDCPDTCGDENLTRTRSCTNPSPENNGTVCQGHTSETISCTTAKCPVNGGWTEWSVWSDCPETCGDEYLTRTRSCTNPSPENNGTDCQGNNTETLSCSTAQCPVNGGWTEWSVWSDCPETCSDEILIRTRSCTNPSPDNNGTACQGNTTETISCSTAKCPVNGKWTEWSVWSDCPETCGDEDLIRTRSCTNPSPGNNGTVCQGSNTETISCTTAQCPVNGGWTEWSIWSDCPETCDDEDLTRTRSCTNPSPENNGTVCQGNTTETISCHTANCPVNGGWTEWSVWSDCPKTCGDEDLIRTRSCSNPSPENNGTVCQGSNTETIPCTTAQCPVNGGWTEWSVWSDCPDTCGDEDLIRTRSCTNPSPENNGTVCQGHDSETIPCYTANCPVNGGWTEWSVWSDCPETCGNEDLIRTRSCTNPSPENNGTVCQGSNTETISCTTAQCPVNGGWTEWSAWSDCPDTCNDEDLIRTRSCTNPSPENNGTVCQGHDSETIPCYTANCPVNGGWTEWSVWSDCPETCGNEDLIRTRSCTNPSPENNGTVCQGSNTETISCTTAQCPVNGGWTEWSAWSDCPDTCNDEDLIRTRSCTNPSPENNGTVCQGHDSETIPCYTANCPVNGGWTEWSVWSDCPETCGNEDLIRTRSCTNPSPENNGTVCQGSNTETISCTTAQCPVNGGWTEWSVWSDCPDTCGDEDLIRTRACTNPSPENNGTVCQGHDSETIPCYTANCPVNGGWTEWSVWSDCPETCGNEDLIRTRSCTNPSPENNGTVCQGSNTETISCTTAQCPVNGGWTEWSVWSDCPDTCGDEDLIRTRACTNPSPENNGTVCQGHDSETIPCYTANCPVNGGWTEWSVWSDCPETCGNEDLIRTRSCTNPSPENNGTVCQGSNTETISCTTAQCPVNGGWTEWSVWSDCPDTCGDEDLFRTRSCANPSPENNGTVCQGHDSETIPCYTANCPVNGGWTEWSVWSDCPETCGNEDLIRTRSCTNPSPENNGTVCQGSNTEIISCTTAQCPVNGGWTEWSVWSDCPETCGDEDLIRTRSCTNPSPENNGTVCQGSNTEIISCTTAQCPVNGGWTEWSVWSDCPETCGDEDLIRTRSCTNPSPENNGTVCQGSNTEIISCTTAQCPVNGGWTEWSVWSDCPDTCGDEDLIRTRSCTNPSPENNGTVCQGHDSETIPCYTANCPVNGGWTEWSVWSDCPETCGDEDLIRTRSCTNPSPENNGTVCQGSNTETISCTTAQCPVNGGWTEWSVWSGCPDTCGDEDLIRTRLCTNPSPENNGTVCQGHDSETIPCYTANCPVNGGWTEWSVWSDCPETCGNEDLIRTRSCTNPSPENNGTVCQGSNTEIISCTTAQCPVNGGWTEWSVWSDCPETCGDEDLIRTRSCTNPSPENNGTVCQGNNTETISCYTANCPVNGGWTEWSVWSDCPETCGDEDLIRTRSCTNPSPENNGTVCQGSNTETISCSTAQCPVNGGWSTWTPWSSCPETCNGETLNRTRSCSNPESDNNGTDCQGNDIEYMSCQEAPCPVNGGWTTWTPWSSCPETCNDEYLNRTRSCSNPASVNNGTDCQGNDIEFKSCQTADCPVNGGWTTWSSWTSCPETCNGEKLSRTRSCSNPESDNNGTDCQGIDIEYISCQEAKCPVNGQWSTWTSWTSCPETCNGEYLNRTRTCSNPASENNGTDCQGDDIEFKSCQTADCPVDGSWTSWSSWSDCPDNCNGEILSRKRNCTNPMPQNGGKQCIGNETETSSCEAIGCPCIVDGGWSPWSSWSACPYSCHGHVLTRDRTCTNPVPTHGGTDCTGNSTDTTSCESQGCPCKGYLHFDMGSGFTRLSFNWKLFGVLSAVLFVWR
ncbi:SCO-spondin-like [Mytilus trossulus]|uniref:SCO-spondin-like n=1 Tax=Mytilus trossulus TaxID=6551 RepID=UPI0030065EF2